VRARSVSGFGALRLLAVSLSHVTEDRRFITLGLIDGVM
jgi:hypothetical protein